MQAWEERVRHMAPDALWYAPMQRDGIRLKETTIAIRGRASEIGNDVRAVCGRAGVEYKSPHKFRHGHIVYARGLASNMEEVKAISQNVMHANAVITDQVYSALASNRVQTVISRLGQNKNDQAELIDRLVDMLGARLSNRDFPPR